MYCKYCHCLFNQLQVPLLKMEHKNDEMVNKITPELQNSRGTPERGTPERVEKDLIGE